MKISEIFYSLQGEGHRVGTPNIFIRLAECNVGCNFCDTDYSIKKDMTVLELHEHIKQYPCKNIIWTGGEPALQLTEEIVRHFKSSGYYNCIETSGSLKIPRNLDYVCCSPKVSEMVLKKNLAFADELKYVMRANSKLPRPSIGALHHFLSPQFDGGIENTTINQEALKHCIKLCLENPGWRLSTQNHKFWNIH